MNYVVLDFTSTVIVPGCLFVYAGAINSSVYLHWGRVTSIKAGPAITFQGIERWGGVSGPRLRDRLTTMHSPDKIVVIPWSTRIPEEIRRLLDPDGKYAAALGQLPPHASSGLVG